MHYELCIMHKSEGYAVFENCDFVDAGFFGMHLLAACHVENEVCKFLCYLFHVGIFYEHACIEVDPIRFSLGEIAVGRNFCSRHESSERSSTSCGEEHNLAA